MGDRVGQLRRKAQVSGLGGAVRLLVQYGAMRATYRIVHDGRKFLVGGRLYPYLSRPLSTERVVELPLAFATLAGSKSDASVLEVGNVLNHFAPFNHDVVDRYEVAAGVVNEDILTFRPSRRYDLIVSISTLEHVGYDEPPYAPTKFRPALSYLVDECLAPGGELFVTVPLGYNPSVDAWVASSCSGVGHCSVLRRTSFLNLWEEDSIEGLSQPEGGWRFDDRYPGAERIAVWSYRRS